MPIVNFVQQSQSFCSQSKNVFFHSNLNGILIISFIKFTNNFVITKRKKEIKNEFSIENPPEPTPVRVVGSVEWIFWKNSRKSLTKSKWFIFETLKRNIFFSWSTKQNETKSKEYRTLLNTIDSKVLDWPLIIYRYVSIVGFHLFQFQFQQCIHMWWSRHRVHRRLILTTEQ